MQPKRLIVSVLVVILMLGAAVMSVSAASKSFELTVEINAPTAIINDPVVLQPGDELDVTVNIKANPGVNMFTFYLAYDVDALELVNDENGLYYSWGSVVADLGGENELYCGPATDKDGKEIAGTIRGFVYDETASKDNAKTGEVITFKFKVKELFHGTAEKLTVSCNDAVVLKDKGFDAPSTKIKQITDIDVHTVVGKITREDADCENPATVSFDCADCDKEVSYVVAPNNGHVNKNIPGTPATCISTGLTDGKYCEVCGKTTKEQEFIPLADHTPGEKATCTTPQLCTVCGEEVKPITHSKVVKDKAVAATCTTPGKTAGKHCKDCDAIVEAQEEIPALGHTPGEAATCTTPQLCTVCNEVVVPAGHTVVIDAAVNATLFTAGKTEGSHCSACGAIIIEQGIIPALVPLWAWIVIICVVVALGGGAALFLINKKRKIATATDEDLTETFLEEITEDEAEEVIEELAEEAAEEVVEEVAEEAAAEAVEEVAEEAAAEAVEEVAEEAATEAVEEAAEEAAAEAVEEVAEEAAEDLDDQLDKQ